MKTLVIGLDCAAPEILLEDERLVNFRRLMEAGCFGRLESVIPPITVPAWMCMSTSQDPGSLGVYGFRNRTDYSYNGLGIVDSRSFRALTIWDQVAMEGGRSIIIGVPPSFPPRKVSGISVGCFLTPDTETEVFTHPARYSDVIRSVVGHYPVDVRGFRTDDKAWLRDEIFEMSRRHFRVILHLMENEDWDYFQFVEIGLDRVHHGFWQHHDPRHVQYEPGNPYENVIGDYYLHLDEELGRIFELLDDETNVLVLSDHGAQPLDGGFCVNEWLVEQGLLVLNSYPDRVTPFGKLDVNWRQTRAWSEGGYYARVFLNIKGREPDGTIDARDALRFRGELQEMLESTTDPAGKLLGTQVFRPEEIYRDLKNIPPDLIVHFGGLSWRSIGGVGYRGVLHTQDNDTGPDGCNHAQFGAFILASPKSPLEGAVGEAHLLDMAPTLLELGGYDIPASMQGRSLVGGLATVAAAAGRSATGEEVIRQRLSGLGYIS